MKQIFKILSTAICTGLLFTSCIKEKYKIDYNEANLKRSIVEITNSPTNRITTQSLDLALPMATLDLGEIRISPRSENVGNVAVVLKQDPVAVTQFAAGQSPAITLTSLPNSSWNLITTNYTLSDGSRVARIRVNINTTSFPSGRVAIGISILSATTAEISGLYKALVVELKPRSPYEGTYTASGTRTSYNGPTVASGVSATFPITGSKFLSTVTPQQVDGIMGDLGFVPFYYTLDVNPLSNAVTVLQSIPNAADTPGTVGNNGTCTYNPATKTFTLNYYYLNGAGNLRQLTETLVRQ